MQEKIKQKNKYKVAMLAPVPFYYQMPLFQKLAKSSKIDFSVFYCSDETLKGTDVEKTYNTKNRFAKAEYLLAEYQYVFLTNYSFSPSFLNWPFGLVNWGIWNEIKNSKYDIVILQAWNNFTWLLAFLACLWFKTSVVFMTDANIFEEELRSKKKRLLKKFFLEKFLFKKSAGFLTTSSVNENLYKAYGVKKEKMVELHYSYGYEKFLEKAKEMKPYREENRKDFGIQEKDFVLMFAGRLIENKNLFTLLDAFSKIDYKEKKLFIVGDGILRNKIEERIKNLNIENVNILGFQSRDSILKFYNIADAFVLPSVDEPWGMVVNEAMCFGLPVIVSSKVGVGVDLVKNEYNGFVFSPNDTEKLSDDIKKIISMSKDERLVFGNRSLEIVSKWIKAVEPETQILKIIELLKK